MRRRVLIKQKQFKKVIVNTLIIICLLVLIICTYNIIKWYRDYRNTEEQVMDIQDTVEVIETEDTNNTEVVKTEKAKEDNQYWKYIKMSLIDVEFTELKKINPDTVGWIQVSGTNINYPFVQTKNNTDYLKHSFDKSYNSAGWIFLDYRNKLDGTDRNVIIYGHSRLDKTMFGTLSNVLTNKWLKNSDNYIVKLSTESENTLWQVFSVYSIPVTNDYIKTKFHDDNEFNEFTNMLISRSRYNFKTSVEKSGKILTLSTCYKTNDRIVLHAKLIKRESR